MATNTNNYTIQQSHINLLWNQGITGKDIIVGIVDTGVEASHEMLDGKIIAGKNFTNDGLASNDITTTHYHGTGVASLVCGKYVNYRAYGIAPDSKVVIAKSLNDEGKGSFEAITNGINYCVEQGADIINCSIGCDTDSQIMRNAVLNAVNNNIPVVVASGNDANGDIGDIDEISYPGCYSDSICVGAMDVDYNLGDFSNSNNYVDVIAPGVRVLTAYPGNRYAYCDGTSFACPIIAGCLALLKQKFRIDYNRDPSEAELYAQLIKYTRYIPGIGRYAQGNGYIDFSINKIRR